MEHSPTPPEWAALRPEAPVTIVKLAPDGHEVARYPGRMLDGNFPADWIGASATWTYAEVAVGGLWFRPGDTLHEYFSATAWFNAFQVLAPGGECRGWYANVTYPSRLEAGPGGPVLFWHDLYIDVVTLADGSVSVLDEDELAESALAERDPAIHKKILEARDLILTRIVARNFPFDQHEARKQHG